MLKQIEQVIETITCDLAEREEPVKLIVLAVLSGEHIILLGPPGTAKSMIARRISGIFSGFAFFEYLLTKFTVPEELFGPLSLKALEMDRFERKTEGYLPHAHVTFLDEIFKANSSILNALLSLINERIFYHGANRMQVPLRCMVGASNEVPREGEGLEALYDRFLLRYIIEPIRSEAEFAEHILRSREAGKEAPLQRDLLESIDKEWDSVTLSEVVELGILRLRQALNDRDIYVSDRRWKKAVKLIKVQALVCGRDTADLFDALILKHVLWSNPQDRDVIATLVESTFLGMEEEDDRAAFLKDAVSNFKRLREQAGGGSWGKPSRCVNAAQCEDYSNDEDYLGQCVNFVPTLDGGCVQFKARDQAYVEKTWFAPAKSAFQFGSDQGSAKARWRGRSPIVGEFRAFHDTLANVHRILSGQLMSVQSALEDLHGPQRHLFRVHIEGQRDKLEIRVMELKEMVAAANAIYEKVHGVYQQLGGA